MNRRRMMALGMMGGVVAPWYLAGGTPIAAYNAVGATGLTDSLVNRITPGTHDLTIGLAPDFSTATGWKFIAPALSTYLISDLIYDTVTQNWSASVCISTITRHGDLFGLDDVTAYRTFYIRSEGVYYWSGYYKSVTVEPGITNGVVGISGRRGYRNGSADGNLMAEGGNTNQNKPLFIGAANDGSLGAREPIGGIISSIIFYETPRTADEMMEIRNAQVALAAGTYPYSGEYFATLGDSKSAPADWPYTLKRLIQNTDGLEVQIKGGQSTGATANYWATNIAAALAAQPATPEPIACLYSLGVNDMASMPLEAAWKADTQTILTALHTKWPTMQIYMCKQWRGDGTTYAAEIASINTWIGDMIASNPTYCQAGHDETVWVKGADNGATMLGADDLHYTAAGKTECYNQWKALLGY